MSEHEYPMPVRQMVNTLAEMCKHQNRADLVEILENAHAQYVQTNYDNWNGGTYTYRLHLGLATSIFATHQSNIEQFESELLERAGGIDKAYDNDDIGEVMITPLTEESTIYGQRLTPSEAETKHLWKDGYFKLFLSHLAEHKVKVHQLKDALLHYGIDAFVAHDDIQPSREWQDEIELALRSMDSLAALVTPAFIESKWCDQEIGWAFGRGIPILPVRLGSDPYGFAGKYQAISGTLDMPLQLAELIFDTLIIKTETQHALCHALPNALLNARSFAISSKLGEVIAGHESYTDSEKDLFWKACQENDQVYGSWGVTDMIYDRIGKPPAIAALEEEPPF
ncbi:MAG: toll/interleukin-1 receptor domain-containing protein [Lentimonas sp.]